MTAQERPGGATLRLTSVAAGRRHPVSEAIGDQQKPPRTRGQGRQLGGATHARGQARGVVAAQSQEGLEELSHVEGQEWRR